MNTCFKIFASYSILQYMCDFIHVLISVIVSECQKSPKLTNIVIPQARERVATQPGSELEECSLCPPDLDPPPSGCGIRPPELRAAFPLTPLSSTGDEWSPPPPPGANAFPPAASCAGPTTSIPLHAAPDQHSVTTGRVADMIPMIMAIIDMAVVILHIHSSSLERSEAHIPCRKKLKRGGDDMGVGSAHMALWEHETDTDDISHPHEKQLHDLLAWHIQVLNAKWYVKPRSTCWFEEYLFNIYTSDMFYDILRMRRVTFDRLVSDLRPFIQGQHTHWRQPIGVERKVVVTLFKLMHGVSIPLVADKAALGKSTVHGILRQVCSAISVHFGHLIAWSVGRRLARVTAAFQAKQWMPNCIGAIDGTHVYIATPPNSIVAADHRNRNKSFSILLQGVVDSKCYFTSVNTGPPGSLHDSAHFKSTELYRKVELGVMGGFHDDPMTWPAGLPFPSYIVADRGYPLLSWCITPYKMGPMGMPITNEETWFNRKHSSTRMSVERDFGILKARFKEIGGKSSLKLEFLPTVVHTCCVLHNILLASKDRTLDQILAECSLPPMDVEDYTQREEGEVFKPPRPMGLVSEERALLEGKMARDDLLDYLVRMQNSDYIGRHTRRA